MGVPEPGMPAPRPRYGRAHCQLAGTAVGDRSRDLNGGGTADPMAGSLDLPPARGVRSTAPVEIYTSSPVTTRGPVSGGGWW